jgi:hypothetical protein
MYVVRLAESGLAVSSIRVALAAIRTARLLTGRSLDLRRHPLEGLATAPQGRSRRPRVSSA